MRDPRPAGSMASRSFATSELARIGEGCVDVTAWSRALASGGLPQIELIVKQGRRRASCVLVGKDAIGFVKFLADGLKGRSS